MNVDLSRVRYSVFYHLCIVLNAVLTGRQGLGESNMRRSMVSRCFTLAIDYLAWDFQLGI